MELFYSRDIEGGICRLDADESGHCVRVLRHRSGDEISVIDGCGTLYRCRITCDSHKESRQPYFLQKKVGEVIRITCIWQYAQPKTTTATSGLRKRLAR